MSAGTAAQVQRRFRSETTDQSSQGQWEDPSTADWHSCVPVLWDRAEMSCHHFVTSLYPDVEHTEVQGHAYWCRPRIGGRKRQFLLVKSAFLEASPRICVFMNPGPNFCPDLIGFCTWRCRLTECSEQTDCAILTTCTNRSLVASTFTSMACASCST